MTEDDYIRIVAEELLKTPKDVRRLLPAAWPRAQQVSPSDVIAEGPRLQDHRSGGDRRRRR